MAMHFVRHRTDKHRHFIRPEDSRTLAPASRSSQQSLAEDGEEDEEEYEDAQKVGAEFDEFELHEPEPYSVWNCECFCGSVCLGCVTYLVARFLSLVSLTI